MKNTCKLCGGKIKNGICTECGMDNRKSDDRYQNVAERKPDNKSEQMSKQKPEWKPNRSKSMPARFSNEKENRNKRFLLILVIVGFILLISPVLGIIDGAIEENMPDTLESSISDIENVDEYEEWEYDPYAHVTEMLNPQGEVWEQSLGAGLYVVGVDIPEGEYTIKGVSGSSYSVHDLERYIYVSESFGTEEYQIQEVQGAKLFKGAIVSIDGMYEVHFSTGNGQVQDMTERLKNPLTETVNIQAGDMDAAESVAGQDFPAGTYDIYAKEENFGIVHYVIENGEMDIETSIMMEKNPTEEYPDYCAVYKNAVLPDGCKLTVDGLAIELVPSQGITTEDYFSFYENYY